MSVGRLAYYLVILGLIWLGVVLVHEAMILRNVENPDGTKIAVVFLGIIAIAIVAGVMVAVTVMPKIGEAIGGFFFSPSTQIEKGPHDRAVAKLAQGDYQGAVDEYKKCIDANPEDTHAMSEVVRIYTDKIGDLEAAEDYLEKSLEKEWAPEQGAFLASRLVDIYWGYRHDAARAKFLLTQITETMPETKYAANAMHRLHEIDRELANEEAGFGLPPAEGGQKS